MISVFIIEFPGVENFSMCVKRMWKERENPTTRIMRITRTLMKVSRTSWKIVTYFPIQGNCLEKSHQCNAYLLRGELTRTRQVYFIYLRCRSRLTQATTIKTADTCHTEHYKENCSSKIFHIYVYTFCKPPSIVMPKYECPLKSSMQM